MSEPAWIPVGPAAVLDVGPEVAYGEITSAVSVTATTEGGATPLVTAPAFTADGTSQYLIEFSCPNAQAPGSSGSGLYFVLYQDGVSIGYIGGMTATGATGPQEIVRCMRRLTPAAGAHVYSVRAFASATGTVQAGPGGAGAYVPTFIRITKVPSAVAGPSGLVPPASIGTALPASPVDGQIFTLVDSLTAPTYSWRLQYLAAKASNKWLYIGGTAKHVDAPGDDVQTTTGIAVANPNRPRFVVPVSGIYRVEFGACGAGVAGSVYAGVGVNASTNVALFGLGVAASAETTLAGEAELAAAAGNSIDLMTYITNSSFTWRSLSYGRGRFISVTPESVGG